MKHFFFILGITCCCFYSSKAQQAKEFELTNKLTQGIPKEL